MRISDWSSDVCSSDLIARIDRHRKIAILREHRCSREQQHGHRRETYHPRSSRLCARIGLAPRCYQIVPQHRMTDAPVRKIIHVDMDARSEEHTSELQSLMRISYAVFFLKKNKH